MTKAIDLAPPTLLRDKLAQLIFVRVGSNLPPIRKVEEDAGRVATLLKSCPVGGLLLFNGHWEQTPETLRRLQAESAYPLLVAADIERGVGQQLHGHSLFPHAMSFSSLGDDTEQIADRFAYLTAVIARAAGIHITLAPVADISVDPKNPIISTRSPGRDAQQVERFVTAYVAGCQRGGLLSTAKHYPGHGNTHEDSHHTLPTVRSSRKEMDQTELVPFRAAMRAGVPLVMTAHVRYPGLDDCDKCATLSRRILVDLLRTELGFRGVVVTDSLLMEGAKPAGTSEAELAVQSLNAGVDVLLDLANPGETLAGMQQAVAAGRLAEDRVDEAVQRLWQLKRQIFCGERAKDGNESVAESVRQAEGLASEVARRAITLVDGNSSRLPLNPAKRTCVLLIRHSSDVAGQEHPLGAVVRRHLTRCDYLEFDPNFGREDCQETFERASCAQQLLLAMIVKPAAWHKFWLTSEQIELLQRLAQLETCVLASLGTPEILHEFETNAPKICTFSDVPVSQTALVHYLLET